MNVNVFSTKLNARPQLSIHSIYVWFVSINMHLIDIRLSSASAHKRYFQPEPYIENKNDGTIIQTINRFMVNFTFCKNNFKHP